ncbi:DUF4097 family beta strand repeat-containing protein [Streptomyces sp. NPDC051907]|uniref:DUF4097 family beta strand repeat-containing protein n=1 Tax=Streptomyces sp. NPDC051907 TaxID=3155284 RepID=UPI003439329B
MPDFDTPEPIAVTIEFDIGSARITAGKRGDTVVEVLPTDAADDMDVWAAQHTQVSYADGRLLVRGPKKRSLFGKVGSVDVTIELPAGSQVHGVSPMAAFSCAGPLTECRLKTRAGDIQVEQAGVVHLETAIGDVMVDRVAGDAEISGSGRVRVGEVAGSATVKNSNGETVVGEVTGDLRARSSNGAITVGRAHGSVQARTASGSIRVEEVARGLVELETAAGNVEVGVRETTAAWLDVRSRTGRVRNSLGASEGPEDSDETVEVRARTGVGDIVIRRS